MFVFFTNTVWIIGPHGQAISRVAKWTKECTTFLEELFSHVMVGGLSPVADKIYYLLLFRGFLTGFSK